MNTLSRRQREFQQREQLFLDTARQIIREHGVHTLTMEKIAAETEYAKGTVYKHFTSKEDLTIALCAQGLAYFVSLCEEMENFPGNPREKLAIVATAYQIYANKFPEEFDLIMEARSGNLREKASPERIQEADLCDARLFMLLHQQIENAVSQGCLELPEGVTKHDICFGLWSMSFGISILQQTKDLLTNIDINPHQDLLTKQLSCLLDGYNWHPLSSEHDYIPILEKAQKHILSVIERNESKHNP